jgi:hypothetical protein
MEESSVIAARGVRQLGIVFISVALASAVLATVAFAQAPPVPPTVEHAAKMYITRSTLEAPIRFLASDALEGRGPATRGDQLARLYLATQLEGLGFQPGGSQRPGAFRAGAIASI